MGAIGAIGQQETLRWPRRALPCAPDQVWAALATYAQDPTAVPTLTPAPRGLAWRLEGPDTEGEGTLVGAGSSPPNLVVRVLVEGVAGRANLELEAEYPRGGPLTGMSRRAAAKRALASVTEAVEVLTGEGRARGTQGEEDEGGTGRERRAAERRALRASAGAQVGERRYAGELRDVSATGVALMVPSNATREAAHLDDALGSHIRLWVRGRGDKVDLTMTLVRWDTTEGGLLLGLQATRKGDLDAWARAAEG